MSVPVSKTSISTSIPIPKPPKLSRWYSQVKTRFESLDSASKIDVKRPQSTSSLSATGKLMESDAKNGPYPGGIPETGPFRGRDPNVKKPEWLRQKAPQGPRFEEVKQSLSRFETQYCL